MKEMWTVQGCVIDYEIHTSCGLLFIGCLSNKEQFPNKKVTNEKKKTDDIYLENNTGLGSV